MCSREFNYLSFEYSMKIFDIDLMTEKSITLGYYYEKKSFFFNNKSIVFQNSTYQNQTNDISLVSSYWGASNDTKIILIRQFCKKLKIKENTKNTTTFSFFDTFVPGFETFTCQIEKPKKCILANFKSFHLSTILAYFTNSKKSENLSCRVHFSKKRFFDNFTIKM